MARKKPLAEQVVVVAGGSYGLGGAIAALAGAAVAFTLGVAGRASEPQPEDADAPRFVAL